MKISTKTGDAGRTKLMFGRDVSKSSQRVRAYGAVDDFSATLGLARSFAGKELGAEILGIQESLVCLMTELATKKEDFHLLTEKKLRLLGDGDLKSQPRETEIFFPVGPIQAKPICRRRSIWRGRAAATQSARLLGLPNPRGLRAISRLCT